MDAKADRRISLGDICITTRGLRHPSDFAANADGRSERPARTVIAEAGDTRGTDRHSRALVTIFVRDAVTTTEQQIDVPPRAGAGTRTTWAYCPLRRVGPQSAQANV